MRKLLLLLLFLFVYCAGSAKMDPAEQERIAREKELAQQELFDPAILPDNFVVPPPDLRRFTKVKAEEITQPEITVIKDTARVDSTLAVPGYRVQIFTSSSFTSTNEILEAARSQITDEIVYLSYDQPFYKIRVGNFLDREDAENFRIRMLRTYPHAWIVRTRVFPFALPPGSIFNDSLFYIDTTIVIDTTGILDTTMVIDTIAVIDTTQTLFMKKH